MSQCEQSDACEVLQRMRSGRLRVFRTLEKFFQQYRLYRRDEHGQRVKQNDLLRSPVAIGRSKAVLLLLACCYQEGASGSPPARRPDNWVGRRRVSFRWPSNDREPCLVDFPWRTAARQRIQLWNSGEFLRDA